MRVVAPGQRQVPVLGAAALGCGGGTAELQACWQRWQELSVTQGAPQRGRGEL